MKQQSFNLRSFDRKVISVLAVIILVSVAVIILSSCSRDEGDSPEPTGSVTVRFGLPQWREPVVISMDSVAKTRGEIIADNKAMTDIWVLDYQDGQLVGQIHQASTDADFASPVLDMSFGSHTLYFVASRGTTPTLDTSAGTIVWERPSDTFYKAVTLDVTRGTATAQTVTMTRVAAKFRITVTDLVPVSADKLIITPTEWYYGLDYTTGDGMAMQAQERSISIPDSYKNNSEKQLYMEIFGLTPADAFTTDMAIRCQAADESVIATASIEGAQIQRNHMTHYTGELFTTSATRGFTLSVGDAAWGDDITGTWQ